MTNSDIHRAQEAAMTEAQTSTEKPVRKSRSTKSQGAAPTEPVDFNKLAQETREKMARKENPPASETVAQAAHAQVQEPAAPMPAHARFQVGQVLGVKAGDGLPGNWSGVMMKFVEPEVYIVRYRWAGETFEGEFERNQLTMMPHPAVGMRLEAGDLVGVRGVQQFGIVSYFDEKKERASVMVAGESATRDFSLEGLDFHGSKVVERSLKFVGLETFALPEAEQPAEDTPEAAPVTAHFAAGDFVKVQQKKETVLAGVQVIHPSGTLYVLLADQGGAITTKPGDCTVTHVRPVAPLRAGDLVHLSLRMGVWEVVSQEGDVVEVVNPLDESEKASSPLSGVLVTRRKNLDDLRADLRYSDQAQQEDMPFPEVNDQQEAQAMTHYSQGAQEAINEIQQPTTPAAFPGWIFPRGQHLAHWWNGEKALCGREVADGTAIEEGSDPSAYAERTCRKCRAALNKQPPAQTPEPAETPVVSDIPAVINDIPGELPGTPMQEIAEPAAIEQVIAEPLGLPSASFVAALGAARKAESEIPGTPTLGTELASSEPLTAESKIEQAASSIVMLPLASLIAWADQPRREFRQDTLEELAKSIHVKGLKQNLTGRPLENGLTEVVIGGRRLRAMNLNAKQGLIDPATYLVPVHVEPLTDLEALEIATLENIEREDMTPLEEADAYARMVELGASPDDIALKMSKSVKTVQQRLTLASGLGDDGRKLYQQGKIGLSQAQVIAQTSGPLRKHVVDAAERGQNAAKLTDLIKQQAFLVEHAKFDVAQSGLEIIPDLYGHTPERFADPKAALAKQLDWVKSRQAALEKGKKQYFVEVLKTDSAYLSLPYSIYTEYNTPKDLQGTVIMVSTVTGEVKEYRCARDADIKSARAKEQAAERKQKTEQATGGEEGGAIRKSAFVDGHKARASALRHALLGDHQRTLALGILALLGSTPIPLRVTYQDVQHAPNPDSMDRLQALDRKLGGALQVDSNRTRGLPLALHHSYDPEGKAEYALLEKLLTLTLEELLELHGILITLAVGGWSEYNPQHAPYSFVTRLAADVNAKVTVKLSDEHLKAYPKDRLLELAKDAGLDYIASNAAKYPTNTALRGAILEMADELHALGYVPPICRFPEPDQAALEQERADQQYREQAKALIPTLTDEQVKELAADVWEIDAAERESVESLRSDLIDEINDLDIDDLREWEVLAKFMPQSTAAD